MPQRIQLSRRKGWRKPEGAIVVARPSRWGNPFRVGEERLRFPRVDGTEAWEQEGRIGYPPGQPAAFHHPDKVTTDGREHYRVTWHEIRLATADEVVQMYRQNITGGPGLIEPPGRCRRAPSLAEVRAHLAGHDLACWCPLDQPCHADVLLELANGDET